MRLYTLLAFVCVVASRISRTGCSPLYLRLLSGQASMFAACRTRHSIVEVVRSMHNLRPYSPIQEHWKLHVLLSPCPNVHHLHRWRPNMRPQ